MHPCCATLDLFDPTGRGAAIDTLHAATALYTREPIVQMLLQRIRWPDRGHRLVDASCGDGAFLGAALQRLLCRHPWTDGTDLLARISGWEIHPFAASQARARLREILLAHGRDVPTAQRLGAAMVRCGDFLTEGPREACYDVVVGNPPYLRRTYVPAVLRTEYEQALPEHARADMLYGFLDRCAALLSAGGELAMVTADRWLFNDGAARLREVIGRRLGIEHVHRIDGASSFYRPKVRRAGTPPRVHPVVIVLCAAASASTPLTRAPVFPGAARRNRPQVLRTLGDVAQVRLAPWLGTAGVFLIGPAAAAVLPADHLVPAVDVSDIEGGCLKPASRYAIRTRPDELPPPQLLAHLQREMPRMCRRGRRRSGPAWLPPEPFHTLDLSRPSLLVPRIARTPRPVRVPAGVLPVGHHLSIVADDPQRLDEIEACLCGEAAAEWLQHHAAPLEGGFRAITARLLRSVPLV